MIHARHTPRTASLPLPVAAGRVLGELLRSQDAESPDIDDWSGERRKSAYVYQAGDVRLHLPA